jgi:hypothetical protein
MVCHLGEVSQFGWDNGQVFGVPSHARRAEHADQRTGRVRVSAHPSLGQSSCSEVDDGIVCTGRAPGARRSGSASLVGAGAAVRRVLHGAARRHDHDRGAAVDRSRSRLLEAGPAVGAERLRPGLRRPAAARRPRGRPARPPSRVPGRCPVVHGRVAHVRARLVAGCSACGPRGPGRRRRDHDSHRPVDHLHDLHRGLRAEQGARDLGRARRHRRPRRG